MAHHGIDLCHGAVQATIIRLAAGTCQAHDLCLNYRSGRQQSDGVEVNSARLECCGRYLIVGIVATARLPAGQSHLQFPVSQ